MEGRRSFSSSIAERSMMAKRILVLTVLTAAGLVVGCVGAPQKPEGVLSVAELLENPVYDTQISVFGEVSLLGELFCPCFILASDGESLEVWYDLMVEDSGVSRPAVSVDGLGNGDWVVVTGELRSSGVHVSQDDFWAAGIEAVQ